MDKMPGRDRPDTTKIYEHYGVTEDYERIKSGEYAAVDFKIFREEELKKATANMAGFGTAKSQRIIIDYDKDYGWFMVKRILRDYGDKDTPSMKS
ncbi:MAG: hypothetical protein HFH56_06105 [Lachnospiraceae bacterium]|nr:hypothetical protein [Lachnospiraceae bacterium]MCI9470773.1 hypothetical protein [Lachnospiraceae bacterium]